MLPALSYFGRCPSVTIPGFLHPVELLHLEDLIRLAGPSGPSVFRHASHAKYMNAEVDEIDAELAAQAIDWVHAEYRRESGAILCFLPVRQPQGWPSAGGYGSSHLHTA